MNEKIKRSWLAVCLFNFFIASLMGLMLRLTYVAPVSLVNYQFLLHGHSHTAMLGWGYMMLFVLIVHFFVPQELQQKKVYNRLFWLTQFSVLGMMVRFPVEGYAMFSIIFSTLHIFCSYYFARLIWKDARPKSSVDAKMLKTSLSFMLLSTLGVWCLGPAIGLAGKASAFYQIAIQFFLHFQFNGWFLFAVLTLFLQRFSRTLNQRIFNRFYYLLVSATVLTLALPVSWFVNNSLLYWINGAGVLLQFSAFYFFIEMFRPHFSSYFKDLKPTEKWLLIFAVFSLGLKVILQLSTLIPELGQVSHQIRHWVIGFIHLVMLGIITGGLFVLVFNEKWISPKRMLMKLGFKSFLFGYIGTELLLFVQGGFLYFGWGEIPNYYQILFGVSCALSLGLFLILVSSKRGEITE